MRFTPRPFTALFALTLGATVAHAAGTVQVAYVQFDKFADAGHASYDVSANLKSLTRVFESVAARHLADGQKLSVEVLDVDLAGEARPSRRGAYEIRVLHGTVDWPRIHLRFTLETPGQPARTGERQLQDMAYLQRLTSGVGRDGLPYEYRLLDDWFAAEFGRAGNQ